MLIWKTAESKSIIVTAAAVVASAAAMYKFKN